MTLNMDYRRWTVVASVLAGSTMAVIGYVTGAVISVTIFLVVMGISLVLLLWFTRPSLGGPQFSHAAAQAAAGDGDVILYWMPG